jgi:hypothetical protein
VASAKQPLNLDDLRGVTLTAAEGFQAMHLFLAAYLARLAPPSADLVTIVSDTEIEADKWSSDPASLSDWLRAVNQVITETGNAA